jgi:hypothetical protein
MNPRPSVQLPPEDGPAHLGRAFNHERTIFTVCATMVGVCLTIIGLIRLVESLGPLRILSRVVLAVDALVFLVGALLSFTTMRSHVRGREGRLLPLADAATAIGLIGLVVVCFTLVFTLV